MDTICFFCGESFTLKNQVEKAISKGESQANNQSPFAARSAFGSRAITSPGMSPMAIEKQTCQLCPNPQCKK